MNFRFLLGDITIPLRRLLVSTVITSGTLSWFFFIDYHFTDIFLNFISDSFWIGVGRALFFGFGAFSAIVGSVISAKINRRKLLLSWITLGVFATASLAIFQGIGFVLLFGTLLGISLGLGFPSGMALLADYTNVEERARITGIVILETFVMVALAIIATSLLGLGLIGVILLCIILRSTSFFALILDSCDVKKGKEKPWMTILINRDFVFYLFPWIMFNIASGLVSFVWVDLFPDPDYDMAFIIAGPLRYANTAIFGLISGIVADRVGRKLPIIIGLVILGVSYAFLGLNTSPLSVLVYLTISGIAWGALMVVYLAVLGDLTFAGSKEKNYALGTVMPLTIYMSLNAIPRALNISAPANLLSPMLSIILFISVIPVLYATETLPQTKIRERKLKEHVKKVGKLVEESRKTK
ncbi:MAG: hypothetical protein PVH73_10330 [Candidatus Bathyarchaeota archaeon]